MRLGLQSFSLHLAFGLHPDCMHYPHKLSLEGCLAKARERGFAALQIDPIHLTDRSPAYLERIRALASGPLRYHCHYRNQYDLADSHGHLAMVVSTAVGSGLVYGSSLSVAYSIRPG